MSPEALAKTLEESKMPLALTSTPVVSFLISSHNRRNVLLETLARIGQCGLGGDEYEIIVVDNASTDGTADAVSEAFPQVHLLRLRDNAGPCSKNLALAHAHGKYVVFLDDDSFPRPGSVGRMIEHFEADPKLGAAVFTVTLPDGGQECSAYPSVFIGCGTGFRRKAVEAAGGLPEDYFMAAEEYVLSLRLLDAGWDIQRFDDLHVTHLKTPGARNARRITRLDVRNNLALAMQLLPPQWALQYACDWTARYRHIARSKGHRLPFALGVMQGIWRGLKLWKRRPVDDWTFETFAKIDETERRLAEAKERHGLERVLFVDYGKNMLAYWRAAQKLNLKIVAIADRNLGGSMRFYRGIPILPDDHARRLRYDAAIIANLSPVHAKARLASWSPMDIRPTIDLWTDGYDPMRQAMPIEYRAALA
jgi:GT2 family glycosyltransferase